MKKILVLDVYKNVDYRISKDTSGGYGTGNDFGNSFVSKILKKKMKSMSDWPPLFAAYTHSVLRKKNQVVYKSITRFSEIENNLDYDFFIIVSSIVCCDKESEIIKKLKKIGKNCITIGPYATNQEKFYIHAGSSVIKGEPEIFFYYNNVEDITEIKSYSTNQSLDLDKLPYPKWNEILDFNKIKLYGNYKSLPILGTRGCPYSCFKYCVYPLQQGRKVRQRSVDKIIEEIKYWKENFNIKLFVFRDPVFSINRKHTLELCDLLIKDNIKIKFVIETHLRILDDELLNKLKSAGLIYVKVGVESVDTNLLKSENRYTIENDKQIRIIKKIEKLGINVSAMYILGYPNDDLDSIKRTIDYSISLNTSYAQFSMYTPYPGTPVFNEFKNSLLTKDFSKFNQYQLVFKHKNFTEKQLKDLMDLAYTKYYFRFEWLTKYGFKKIINVE